MSCPSSERLPAGQNKTVYGHTLFACPASAASPAVASVLANAAVSAPHESVSAAVRSPSARHYGAGVVADCYGNNFSASTVGDGNCDSGGAAASPARTLTDMLASVSAAGGENSAVLAAIRAKLQVMTQLRLEALPLAALPHVVSRISATGWLTVAYSCTAIPRRRRSRSTTL